MMADGGERLRDLDAGRRRILNIGTRSRALLELGDLKIRKMEARPRPAFGDEERAAKYEQFNRSVCLVRLMASGQVVRDGGHRMGPVVATDDLRLSAISGLAELASVSPAQLDDRTGELALSEDRGLELCEEFMSTLPQPRRPRLTTVRRPQTRDDRAQAWATTFEFEASDTWALIRAMPGDMPSSERKDWESELLGETDAEFRLCESKTQPTEPSQAPVSSMLKAAAIVYRETRRRLAEAERTKSQRVAEARASSLHKEGEPSLLEARETELHAGLVEPISAELGHVERLLIQAAIRVEFRMTVWPGRGPAVVRALNLAATMSAEDDDLHHAFATLGYARTGDDNATT